MHGRDVSPRMIISGSYTGRISSSVVRRVFIRMTINRIFSESAETWEQCEVSDETSRSTKQVRDGGAPYAPSLATTTFISFRPQ